MGGVVKATETTETTLIIVLILAVAAWYFVLRKRDNDWILRLAEPSDSVAEAT